MSRYRGLPTKWRSYRDHRLRDVNSLYVYTKVDVQYNKLAMIVGRTELTTLATVDVQRSALSSKFSVLTK